MSQRESFEAAREARRSSTATGAARSARHEESLAEAMAAAYYRTLRDEEARSPSVPDEPAEDAGAEAEADGRTGTGR